MARMTSRKDPIASFIWTAGAADMVIGGVGERGSLFALGLLTVGAGVLVRWLRQQRSEHSAGAWRDRVAGPLPGGKAFSARAFSVTARGFSTFLAQQLRSTGVTTPSRRGYSAAARPGFRANRFVHSAESQPRQNSRNAPSVQRARLIPRPEDSASRAKPRNPGGCSGDELRQGGTASTRNRSFQGPPLNLPPAPRGRSRRGRRIY